MTVQSGPQMNMASRWLSGHLRSCAACANNAPTGITNTCGHPKWPLTGTGAQVPNQMPFLLTLSAEVSLARGNWEGGLQALLEAEAVIDRQANATSRQRSIGSAATWWWAGGETQKRI